jgi:hypothetical protein
VSSGITTQDRNTTHKTCVHTVTLSTGSYLFVKVPHPVITIEGHRQQTAVGVHRHQHGNRVGVRLPVFGGLQKARVLLTLRHGEHGLALQFHPARAGFALNFAGVRTAQGEGVRPGGGAVRRGARRVTL